VKVEAGSVTITASGTGTYYIGEEITLSGTNTEVNRVYLFMTGPNLASRWCQLETPGQRLRLVIKNFTSVMLRLTTPGPRSGTPPDCSSMLAVTRSMLFQRT
jgi:hypothetical protein